MQPADIEVVIPAYEAGPELLACLDSIAASSLGVARVTIVENAPSDITAGRLGVDAGWVEVIRNPENLGFGVGCNLGIQRALERGATFVLLLNQDTTLARTTIGRLIAFAESRPRVGALGPRTLAMRPRPDGRERLLYAGAWRRLLPLWQRIPGINGPDTAGDQPPVRVDYLWGHGLLLRAEAIRAVGAFDPAFFMYDEDLDLCVRLRRAGWELWCVRDAVMWHDIEDGARAGHSEAWRWSQKVRSAQVFHRKHAPGWRAGPLTVATVLRELITLGCRGQWTAVGHLLRASLRELAGSPPLVPTARPRSGAPGGRAGRVAEPEPTPGELRA